MGGLSWSVLCSCYVKFLWKREDGVQSVSVDLKLRRQSLRDFPEDLAVSKAVFIVLSFDKTI